MWARDQYFPASYAHATWHRLAGTVAPDACTVRVELRPFNDRALNRDLVLLCERINQASPRLPDEGLLLRDACPQTFDASSFEMAETLSIF